MDSNSSIAAYFMDLTARAVNAQTELLCNGLGQLNRDMIMRNNEKYMFEVAGVDLDFTQHEIEDQMITGHQVADAVGAHPVAEFVILHQLGNLELEAMRPTETADLSTTGRFIVIRGAVLYVFTVDGLHMTWPLKAITGGTIKTLVQKVDDDIELLLEREDQPDKVIGDDDEVRLGKGGLEKFRTRPVQSGVMIIVEGTPHQWAKKKISYDEVVTLEVPDYPQHPDITYSVKFTNWPKAKRSKSKKE